MNYWLLTTEYPPHYGGGISTYCYHTAQMLTGKGHQVTVFIPEDTVTDITVSYEENIRIVRFSKDRHGMGSFLGYSAKLSYEFVQILKVFIRKEGKPDYIEAQEYLGIAYFLLQFKHLKYEEFQNIPVILTLHSPAFLYLYYNREGVYVFPNYWTGEMEKSCIQAADIILAPSKYIIDEVKRHALIAYNKTHIIRNPIQVDNAGLHAEESKILRNKILFYGKLSPQKGVFEMLIYFKELWDSGFPHALTIIGGTDKVYYPEMKTMGVLLKTKYQTYINKGLLSFKGKIRPEEKDLVLADAHVVLIPSLNDNLPYAAIEAMIAGKVVLASVQGGQAELIEHAKTGFLFDHQKQGDFAAQLKTILDKSSDDLNVIGKAAKESIRKNLCYEQVYSQKIKILSSLADNKAANSKFPFTRVYKEKPPQALETNKKGLLSIIIPFFNLSAYLEECLQSVFNSTYTFFEVLIVNDGSSDVEYARLQKLHSKYRFIILNQPNTGLAAARNNGAQNASGEYIAFLDADDKIHPSYYEKAIKVLQAYDNVHFAGCWVQFFGGSHQIWPTWNPEPPYILTHNSVNSSALVYKKAAFIQGGWNDKQADYGVEDYESVVNMLDHGFGGIVLPELLFFYRIRKDSMYRAFNRYKALYSYDYISQKHSDFYNTFAPQVFNILNANGPAYSFDNPTLEMKVTAEVVLPNRVYNQLKSILKRNQIIKSAALYIKRKLKL